MEETKDYLTLDSLKSRALLIVYAVIVLTLPVILTSYSWYDFTETGQIGDTIGGITAPFIGLISAFLIYKAFEEQRKANEYQITLIKAQQHDREFTIYFKLIDELKETTNIIQVGDRSLKEFSDIIMSVGFSNPDNPLLLQSDPPTRFSLKNLLEIEPLASKMHFVTNFIVESSVEERFFEQKFTIDFKREIDLLVQIHRHITENVQLHSSEVNSPIFEQIDGIVKFKIDIERK
ncbi:MAG: hypothetical protein RJQ09_03910 [Cyclobacteriaceae bacterium]